MAWWIGARLARWLAGSRLYISSTASLAIGVLAQTLGFVILARELGREDFGRLSVITSLLSIGLVFCSLGSPEMLRRKVGRDRSAYPSALGHSLIVLAITGVGMSILLTIMLNLFIRVSDDTLTNIAIMLSFSIATLIMYPVIVITENICLAYDDVRAANFVNSGSAVARTLFVVAGCYGFGVHGLATWAVWNFGFYLAVTVGCAVLLRRYGAPKLQITHAELKRGLALSISGLFVMLRQNVDVLALGAMVSAEVVGEYSVARRIVTTAAIVSHSFDRLVYSNFVVAGKTGAVATMRLALGYAPIVIGLCLSMSALLFVCAPLLVPIFGDRYVDAVALLKVLSWSLIFTGLYWLAADALNAADKHQMRLIAEAASCVVGSGALIVLTTQYALTGALVSVYLLGALVAGSAWAMLTWVAAKG